MANLYQLPDISGIDWDKWNEESQYDPHAVWCMELVEAMATKGYHIVFLTGRSDFPKSRDITEKWLQSHVDANIKWTLIMRPAGDQAEDAEAKYRIYWDTIEPHFDILFAVDDKLSNIAMWRTLGIPALHCADY